MTQGVRVRKIAVFLALAYGMAWPLGFGFFALGGRINSGPFVAVAVVYMFTPALAALIVQKFIWKEALRDIGLRNPPLRWAALAWLLPILLVVAALGLSVALPGVSLVTDLEGFIALLADKVPPEHLTQLKKDLGQSILAAPGVLLLLSFGQALLAGPTVNAGVALGEELGWRGLFMHELKPLGFWRSSLVIGFFWGLWHLPIIVNGYNYPGYPILGPIMMTVLTVLLSPIIGYVTWRADSVLAAAVFHGTFNAAASLAFFLSGGSVLVVGMTGLAGMLTLVLANVALWFHLRGQGELFDQRIRE